MRTDLVSGVEWYLHSDAPVGAGVGVSIDAGDSDVDSLDAFYDAWLPLYDASPSTTPAPSAPGPSIERGTSPTSVYSDTVPAFPAAPQPLRTATSVSQILLNFRSVPRPSHAQPKFVPLSTIYSIDHHVSAASLATAPISRPTACSSMDTAGAYEFLGLHRGVSAPLDYDWPAYLGDDGRPRLKGLLHKAAKGRGGANLRALIIDAPYHLTERHPVSGRIPLACAARKGRFRHAMLILSGMQAYGVTRTGVINHVGYDGRNALMLTMDANVHRLDALAFFDALLRAGANPQWPCPIPHSSPMFAWPGRKSSQSAREEHAADYALRADKALWLHKLLLWDEAQRQTSPSRSYAFAIQDLRAKLAQLNLPPRSGVGRVLKTAEERRDGHGLVAARGRVRSYGPPIFSLSASPDIAPLRFMDAAGSALDAIRL